MPHRLLRLSHNMNIYLITNSANDMAYIGGCAMPLKRRWSGHLSWARRGRGYSLHQAIREIGEEKFNIVSVWSGYVSRESLKKMEEYYIHCFNTLAPNGYNETIGGTTRIFAPCSPEKAARISATLKGHPISMETRKRISETLRGRLIH